MITEGFLLYDTDGWNFLWWSTKENYSYEANQLSMKGALYFMRRKQQFQVPCKLDNLASWYHSTTGTSYYDERSACCSRPLFSLLQLAHDICIFDVLRVVFLI